MLYTQTFIKISNFDIDKFFIKDYIEYTIDFFEPLHMM